MAVENKCKKCAGSMEYDPNSTNLVCRKCGNTETFEKDNNIKSHAFDMDAEIVEPEFNPQVLSSHCSNCGAVYGDNTSNIAGVCDYCGAHLTRDFSLNKTSEPDGCIPFAFDKNQAREKFREGLKKEKFLPNKFMKQLPKSEVESIYIPAYLFNTRTENGYVGRIYDIYKDSDGSTERSYRRISGNESVDTKNILVECSSQLNQLTLDKIRPFDFNQLQSYRNEFLMGYSVEYYDKKLEEAKSLVKETVKIDVRKKILRNYNYDGVDYIDINTNYTHADYSRIILPTYRLTYNYGGKEYKTFLNGQTGKVGGKLPRSKVKIFFFVMGIVLGFALFLYLMFK